MHEQKCSGQQIFYKSKNPLYPLPLDQFYLSVWNYISMNYKNSSFRANITNFSNNLFYKKNVFWYYEEFLIRIRNVPLERYCTKSKNKSKCLLTFSQFQYSKCLHDVRQTRHCSLHRLNGFFFCEIIYKNSNFVIHCMFCILRLLFILIEFSSQKSKC